MAAQFGHPVFPPGATMNMGPNGPYTSMPTANMFNPAGDDDDEDDEYPNQSIVKLTIDAPTHIRGDNNLVSLEPSATGSKIALAIISGLQQMSGSAGGVPMIDENGRPRPIRVEVKAETTIEGSRNVVGERAVFTTVLLNGPKRDPSSSRPKRERASSEPLETESKRIKTN